MGGGFVPAFEVFSTLKARAVDFTPSMAETTFVQKPVVSRLHMGQVSVSFKVFQKRIKEVYLAVDSNDFYHPSGKAGRCFTLLNLKSNTIYSVEDLTPQTLVKTIQKIALEHGHSIEWTHGEVLRVHEPGFNGQDLYDLRIQLFGFFEGKTQIFGKGYRRLCLEIKSWSRYGQSAPETFVLNYE